MNVIRQATRDAHNGTTFSLDPAPVEVATAQPLGNSTLAASLPPGKYVFEQDERGLRIYLVVDATDETDAPISSATIRAGVRDGSQRTPSMEQVARLGAAFYRDAEARADAEACGTAIRPAVPTQSTNPTLVAIQARNNEFWRGRGG